MAQQEQQVDWREMLSSAGPYPLEAFCFVREGLAFTADRVHGTREDEMDEADRHISGQELCLGLRDFAIERYGMLAPVVLGTWHIRRTEDFGRIVFAMIDFGLMSRTADDTLEDFCAVYDFGEAFSRDELLGHLAAS